MLWELKVRRAGSARQAWERLRRGREGLQSENAQNPRVSRAGILVSV